MKSMLIMVFCVAVCITGQTQAANPAEEDSIRETVFRYQFDHTGQQKKAMVYCLSLSEKGIDPPDLFILRFGRHSPPVRKLSECTVSPLDGVKDKRIGIHGLLFFVADIRWLSNSKAEVSG
jgi:hypothetical protein